MASEKQFKYVYTRVRPTNVCFNGVSFPVLPRDVIKCYPKFIQAFIDPKYYIQLEDADPREPKYTFGRSPTFLHKDVTGGLPVRSNPDAGPRLHDKLNRTALSPALVEDTKYANPYEMPTEEAPEKAKLEASTLVGAVINPVAVTPETPVEVEEEEVEEEISELEKTPVPNKTTLRRLTRDDVFGACKDLLETGCPLAPEMSEEFEEFDEETTRGVMFPRLWAYYGYK